MVGAQDPLAPGQILLEQRDGLGGPARRLVGRGQVVPGGQDPGMLSGQPSLADGENYSSSGIASLTRPTSR